MLHLIPCILKAASCTLDASAKIYAYRVDCVHIDTIKMAGGLGRTGNDGQEKEGNEQVEGDQDDPSRAKKKARVSHKAFNWKCLLFVSYF